MKFAITLVAASALYATGCASTYGNLVSGSNLGAQEYQPAVLPNAGMEGKYREVLGVCRQVAVNRQVTAADEAQLKTITGAVQGGGDGLAGGLQMGFLFKQAGLGKGAMSGSIGVGLVSGLVSSLAGSFASGATTDASETKAVLLQCLRKADPQERLYKVIE
jgi:hypothetical protein